MKTARKFLFLFLILSFSLHCAAETYYWRSSVASGGDWSDAENWSTAGETGTPAANAPSSSDNVIFNSAATVTGSGAIECANLTVTASLTISGADSLTCGELIMPPGSSGSINLEDGDLTVKDYSEIRGNVSAKNIVMESNCFFGGAVSSVTAKENQTYKGDVEFNYDGIEFIAQEISINGDFYSWKYGESHNAVFSGYDETGVTVSFNKTVGEKRSVKNLTINGDASFSGVVTVDEKISVSGDLTINSKLDCGEITADSLTVETGGELTCGDITTVADFTIESGAEVTAASAEVGGNLTIAGSAVFSDASKELSVGRDLLVSGTLETAASAEVGGNLTIAGSASFSDAAKELSVGGDLLVSGTLETAAQSLTANSLTVKSAATLTAVGITIEKKILAEEGAKIAGEKIIQKNENGANQIAGIEAGEAEFAADSFLSGESLFKNDAEFGGDLYICAPSSSVVFGETVSVTGNFALFGGAVEFSGNLAAEKDVILLNGKVPDIYADSETGLDLFRYNKGSSSSFSREGFTAKPNLEIFPEKFPDGTEINHSEYKSSIKIPGGFELSTNGNFYCNGVDLKSDSTWTLSVPENDSALDSFAEIYNASILNCTAENPVSAAEGCEDGGGNSNVFFDRAKITECETVFDDVIKISFDVEIENSNGEISKALKHIKYSENLDFEGAYTDEDCTDSTDEKGDLKTFYLKANGTWNTDATGKSPGDEQSTDRNGIHQTAVPSLKIPKAVSGVFSVLKDKNKNRLKNYKKFDEAADKAKPVLIGTRTGQELHAPYDKNFGAASQSEYDAHNFIEFRYSEKVEIGGVEENAVNVPAADYDEKNEKSGGNISEENGGIKIDGFAEIEKGALKTGNKKSDAEPVHALYRNFSTKAGGIPEAQTHRVRISIAGFSDSTVQAPLGFEETPYEFRNWNGYIESAETPGGKVTPLKNVFIKDECGNVLDFEGTKNHPLKKISVDSKEIELYGAWDCSPPAFAPFKTLSQDGEKDGSYEIAGAVNSDASFYLDNIEFHLFDNDENGGKWWRSMFGWKDAGDTADNSDSIPDFSGGSRPHFSGAKKTNSTSGGIRRSSLAGASDAFSYSVSDSGGGSKKSFGGGGILQTVKSGLFLKTGGSQSGADSLYLNIPLNESDAGNLPVTTKFDVRFDGKKSFITDLAGNRLKKSVEKMTSVEVVQPNFVMSFAPVGEKLLYILFSKKLYEKEYDDFAEKLNSAVEFEKTQDGGKSDISIENAEYISGGKSYSVLKLTLNREVTFSDVKNLRFKVVGDEDAEKFTTVYGQQIFETYIHDEAGNSIQIGKKHTLSDFALNAVEVLYAYADVKSDSGDVWNEKGIYDGKNYAVRDFSSTAGNYGKLRADADIYVQIKCAEGVENPLLVADSQSDVRPEALATKIEKQTGEKWRLWLDEKLDSVSNGCNDSPEYFDAEELESNEGEDKNLLKTFKIPEGEFQKGDEVQFFFKLDDEEGDVIRIDHDGDETTGKIPLYALTLEKNALETGLPFVDLWSFSLESIKAQRGGVTILNNVINVSAREETVVEVNLAEKGNLNVTVMTLDGNIIKRLCRGEKTPGTHYFKWNGTNNAGKPVARGMYFVRVTAPGIDETRKVLCVRE